MSVDKRVEIEPVIARVIVLELLRQAEGGKVEGELARALLKYPVYDYLPAGVHEEDMRSILNMADSSDSLTKDCAAALLRGINSNEAEKYWLSQWREAETYSDRLRAAFSVTDYRNLPESIHEELYTFIRENWEQWQRSIAEWYGTSTTGILGGAKERLLNPTFPPSKAWVYLCVAVCDASAETKELVKEFIDHEHAFTKKVARALLSTG